MPNEKQPLENSEHIEGKSNELLLKEISVLKRSEKWRSFIFMLVTFLVSCIALFILGVFMMDVRDIHYTNKMLVDERKQFVNNVDSAILLLEEYADFTDTSVHYSWMYRDSVRNLLNKKRVSLERALEKDSFTPAKSLPRLFP